MKNLIIIFLIIIYLYLNFWYLKKNRYEKFYNWSNTNEKERLIASLKNRGFNSNDVDNAINMFPNNSEIYFVNYLNELGSVTYHT